MRPSGFSKAPGKTRYNADGFLEMIPKKTRKPKPSKPAPEPTENQPFMDFTSQPVEPAKNIDSVRAYLSMIGRKGGTSRSAAKVAASRVNAKKDKK
jgi:hypothetical protein